MSGLFGDDVPEHLIDPEWFILGSALRGERGVMVVATTDLLSAHLSWKQIPLQVSPPYKVPRDRIVTNLNLAMGERVIVYADTYEEAVSDLFGQWRPESKTHPELTERRPEIGPGRPELEE